MRDKRKKPAAGRVRFPIFGVRADKHPLLYRLLSWLVLLGLLITGMVGTVFLVLRYLA